MSNYIIPQKFYQPGSVRYYAGFSLDLLDMGGFVPPPYGGYKALMGGLMKGDIDLMVGT